MPPKQALKVLNKSFLKRKREYKRVDGKLVLSNAFQVRSLLCRASRRCTNPPAPCVFGWRASRRCRRRWPS